MTAIIEATTVLALAVLAFRVGYRQGRSVGWRAGYEQGAEDASAMLRGHAERRAVDLAVRMSGSGEA